MHAYCLCEVGVTFFFNLVCVFTGVYRVLNVCVCDNTFGCKGEGVYFLSELNQVNQASHV